MKAADLFVLEFFTKLAAAGGRVAEMTKAKGAKEAKEEEKNEAEEVQDKEEMPTHKKSPSKASKAGVPSTIDEEEGSKLMQQKVLSNKNAMSAFSFSSESRLLPHVQGTHESKEQFTGQEVDNVRAADMIELGAGKAASLEGFSEKDLADQAKAAQRPGESQGELNERMLGFDLRLVALNEQRSSSSSWSSSSRSCPTKNLRGARLHAEALKCYLTQFRLSRQSRDKVRSELVRAYQKRNTLLVSLPIACEPPFLCVG